MNPRQIWNQIIDKLSEEEMEHSTVPKGNRTPVWFTASTEGDVIYINEAVKHRPSSKLSGERRLNFKEFERVYPIYLRCERGEQVSAEAQAATVNSVYWFSLMKWLGE